MKSGEIFYDTHGDAYVVKFVGEIRSHMGCSLNDHLKQALDGEELRQVYIDLLDATSLDSTSLGLLAKIANALRQAEKPKAIVLSDSDDINQVLESMGLDEIFTIRASDNVCPCASKHLDVIAAPARDEMQQTVLEAHNVLIDLNEKNRQTFQELIEVIEKPAGGYSSS